MKKWLNSFFRPVETKASKIAPLLVTTNAHTPIWTPRQYDTLTEEGYQKNIVVYRCVSLISRGIASVPWQLYKEDSRLESHPLLTLLYAPNPQQGLSGFMEGLAAYLLLAGNVYIEAVVSGEEPAELIF